MSVNHLLISLTMLVMVTAIEHLAIDELLTTSDNELLLNEDLARLLKIDYDRQGACDTGTSSDCCNSCTVDGSCANGGICCELSKVRTRMLGRGEIDCPNSLVAECKLTKVVAVSSHSHYYSGSDSSSSESDEDRHLEKSGFRLMCVCLSSKRCCSGPVQVVTTTAPPPSTTVGETTTMTPYPYNQLG